MILYIPNQPALAPNQPALAPNQPALAPNQPALASGLSTGLITFTQFLSLIMFILLGHGGLPYVLPLAAHLDGYFVLSR